MYYVTLKVQVKSWYNVFFHQNQKYVKTKNLPVKLKVSSTSLYSIRLLVIVVM